MQKPRKIDAEGPKGTKRKPKGTSREPKGTKKGEQELRLEAKVDKRGANDCQWRPKSSERGPKGSERERKGAKRGEKGSPKAANSD